MIRIIAKRYAKALAQLAEEKKIVDETRADLAAFVGAVDRTVELRCQQRRQEAVGGDAAAAERLRVGAARGLDRPLADPLHRA